MPVTRIAISGSPYLGVYLKVSERAAAVPLTAPASVVREIRHAFGVEVVRTTIGGSDIVGAMVAVNSRGAIVGDGIDDAEREALQRFGPVHTVATRFNALGNNVLANDSGALVHPEFSNEAVRVIGAALGVPIHRGTLAGLGTVGMAGVATNKGAVVHPKATEKEAELVGEVLKVPVARSTANFGVPIVGACLVANTRALAVGRPTTPVEIVHLQDGLQVYE